MNTSTVQFRVFILLALSELLFLCIILLGCAYVRELFGGAGHTLYYEFLPFLCFAPLFFAVSHLYPWPAVPQHQELKITVQGITYAYALILLYTFLGKETVRYSRMVLCASWLFSLPATVILRHLLRNKIAENIYFTTPAILFGRKTVDKYLARIRRLRPTNGLDVVGMISTSRPKGAHYKDIRVLGGINDIQEIARTYPGSCAIVSERKKPEAYTVYGENLEDLFTKVIVLPEMGEYDRRWADSKDLGGILGLELHQNLLDIRRKRFKRCLDCIGSVIGLIVALPIFLLLALLIKIDSRGSVFYGHERVGLEGKSIFIWKFRTMYANSDEILKKYLADNANARQEWEANQKLRDDPRITRVGSFLRHFSLDELPQLWNILLGELSLVGPRPIVESEIEKYAQAFSIYCKVVPGLTGLWQVSGRNLTSYEERVELDIYYINNWSLWLDIFILCRTVPAILLGKGAY